MPYLKKTHCKHGHEYTEENTRLDKKGARVCRECNRTRYVKKEKRKVCRRGHDLTVEGNVRWDKLGRRRGCRPCYLATGKVSNKRNALAARKSRFRIEYGITVEEYDEMYESQKGRCKICGTRGERYQLNLDHCHKSRRVRGLLCRECNHMLGLAHDDPAVLRAGANYLEQV